MDAGAAGHGETLTEFIVLRNNSSLAPLILWAPLILFNSRRRRHGADVPLGPATEIGGTTTWEEGRVRRSQHEADVLARGPVALRDQQAAGDVEAEVETSRIGSIRDRPHRHDFPREQRARQHQLERVGIVHITGHDQVRARVASRDVAGVVEEEAERQRAEGEVGVVGGLEPEPDRLGIDLERPGAGVVMGSRAVVVEIHPRISGLHAEQAAGRFQNRPKPGPDLTPVFRGFPVLDT